MELNFVKYHGAGNDFVLVDDRKQIFPRQDSDLVARICHRQLGIGGDGMMLLEGIDGYDFKMLYYNADGYPGTMCGNGGRSIVAFARDLGIVSGKANFLASDGPHTAEINDDGTISLGMSNVSEITRDGDTFFLNTGSPHLVLFCEEDIQTYPVVKEGRELRYSPKYTPDGTNVNFVWKRDNGGLFVRTYERGVEDETLSCGTGVTACSLIHMLHTVTERVEVETLGGKLEVTALSDGKTGFKNIILRGPAVRVFEGKMNF